MAAKLPDLRSALNLAFGPAHDRRQIRCVAMTDPERHADVEAMIDGLPPQSLLIFRHYGVPDRARLAHRAVRRGHARSVPVLIAGDPVLARETGADGVHLPSHQLRRAGLPERRRRHPDWLVSAAVHSIAELARAARLGADMATISPVFPTPSHPQARCLGPLRTTALCRQATLPLFALGGIAPGRIRRLKGSGIVGVAGIGMFGAPS